MNTQRPERPLKDWLEPRLGEREVAAALDGARARRSRRRGRGLLVALGGASLALAALLLWLERAPAPLTLANHDTLDIMEAREPRMMQMNDGSNIALAPGTRLDTVANEGGVFGTTLIRGRAEFEVRPGGGRRWLVHAGDVTVEVVGTHFVVKRDAASVWVHVTRGKVLVRGARVDGGARSLSVGDSLTVPIEAPPKLAPARAGDEPADEPMGPLVPRGPYAIDVQRISGDDPHLPDAVKKRVRGHDTPLVARICVDKDGAVSSVAVLQGIDGADATVKAALETWRYEPQPIPVCFVTQLMFSVQ